MKSKIACWCASACACGAVLAGEIPWSDGEKGGTLSFGAEALGDNTLTLPQRDYTTQVKNLSFAAGSGGTLTVNGGTAGYSFGMATNYQEYAYDTYPFNINGANGSLLSVWRQTVFLNTWGAYCPQIEITNAQFRVVREGTTSKLHLDGGYWNAATPYGSGLSWADLVFASGTGDDQFENRIYVHKDATIVAGNLGFEGAAGDYNLLQFDGGSHYIQRNLLIFPKTGVNPEVAHTAELIVTGKTTSVTASGAIILKGPPNESGAGMGIQGGHTLDTAIVRVTDGAKLTATKVTDWGGTAGTVFDVSRGGVLKLTSGGFTTAGSTGGQNLILTGNGGRYEIGALSGIRGIAATNCCFSMGYSALSLGNGGTFEFVDCAVTNGNFSCGQASLRMKGGTWKLGYSVGPSFGSSAATESSVVFDGTYVNNHQEMIFGAAESSRVTAVLTNNAYLYSDSIYNLAKGKGSTAEVTVRDGALAYANGNYFKLGTGEDSVATLFVLTGGVCKTRAPWSGFCDQIGVTGTGTLKIIGGSYTNLSSRDAVNGMKLGVNAGSAGTVEIRDGGTLRTAYVTGGSGTSVLIGDGGTLMPEVKYNVINDPTTEARQADLLYGLTTAKVGAKGLTIYNPWTTTINVAQAFENLDDEAGVLRLTGTGGKNLTGANACSLIRVEGGDVTIVSATATMQAVGTGRIRLADGAATAVTYGGLILGEGTTGGILAVDAADTITVTTAPVFDTVYVDLCDAPANGTYPLVKTSAAVSGAVKTGWAAAYLHAGRQDGKMYAFTVSEADGVTSFNLVVDDSRALDPTLVRNYNGAGGTVTVGTVDAVDAVAFDSENTYSIAGDGAFTFNDTGAGYVNALSGSHVLGIGLIFPAVTPFYVAAGAALEISGNIRNGAVTKTGTGQLTLSGTNSFMDDLVVTGGILRVTKSEAFGYNAAARSNKVILRNGTLEFESVEEDASTLRELEVDTGDDTTAVMANIKSPLAFNNAKVTKGAFIKRGAAPLTLAFAETRRMRNSPGRDKVDYFDAFPADGSSPTTASYCGLNVAEGALILKGPAGCKIDIDSGATRIGLQTADGTVAPSFVADGVHMWGANDSLFMGATDKRTFNREAIFHLKNGAHYIGLSLQGQAFDDEEGSGSFTNRIVIEGAGSYSATYGGVFFSSGDYCRTEITVKDGGALTWGVSGESLKFASPFALNVTNGGRLMKSGGYSWGDGAMVLSFNDKATGTARFENADFRCASIKRTGTKPVTLRFDGTTWYPKDADVALGVAEPTDFTMDVTGAGLIISNESGRVFSTTNAFTGTGKIVKAGAGTLTFARMTAGAPTMDVTGGLEIREGVVMVSNGTMRTDAVVTIAAGAVLDLGGSMVEVDTISGKGTVRNGTLKARRILLDGSDLHFENATLACDGVLRVDFGRDAAHPIDYKAITPVTLATFTGVTQPALRVKVIRSGVTGLGGTTVVEDGVFKVNLVPYGFYMLIR